MIEDKETEFAFHAERKESLAARLRELAERHKSLRAASREWGMSFSTLNNYINRGTEPSFFAMVDIAEKESVTIDWLAYGKNDEEFEFTITAEGLQKVRHTPGRDTWLMIFDNLTMGERLALLNYCIKAGAPNLVKLATEVGATEREFLALPAEDRDRVMRLYEQMKKGSSENRETIAKPSPSKSSKKAS